VPSDERSNQLPRDREPGDRCFGSFWVGLGVHMDAYLRWSIRYGLGWSSALTAPGSFGRAWINAGCEEYRLRPSKHGYISVRYTIYSQGKWRGVSQYRGVIPPISLFLFVVGLKLSVLIPPEIYRVQRADTCSANRKYYSAMVNFYHQMCTLCVMTKHVFTSNDLVLITQLFYWYSFPNDEFDWYCSVFTTFSTRAFDLIEIA